MNVFVYSVKSYSEVGSRDYLVATNKRICLLFGSWFRNSPEKEQELGERGAEKTSFQVRAVPVKTQPYYGMVVPSSLASNAMHLHPYSSLAHNKVN